MMSAGSRIGRGFERMPRSCIALFGDGAKLIGANADLLEPGREAEGEAEVRDGVRGRAVARSQQVADETLAIAIDDSRSSAARRAASRMK